MQPSKRRSDPRPQCLPPRVGHISRQSKLNPLRAGPLQDSSKAIGLLFGMLVILTLFGVAVNVRMLWTGSPAGLVEIVLFGLLAADAAVLLIAAHRGIGPGPVGYLSVWILGLIPYFGWVIIYAAGRGIAGLLQNRRANSALLALLVWISVVMLCLGVHLFVGGARLQP